MRTFIKGFLLAGVVCFSVFLSVQAQAEDPPVADHVADTRGEQQQAAEGDQVAVDHPLLLLGGQMQARAPVRLLFFHFDSGRRLRQQTRKGL